MAGGCWLSEASSWEMTVVVSMELSWGQCNEAGVGWGGIRDQEAQRGTWTIDL